MKTIVFILSVLVLTSCTKSTGSPDPIMPVLSGPVRTIPLSDASGMLFPLDGVTSFTLNMDQFAALVHLYNANPMTSGFRIYMAGDSTLICNVTGAGKDIKEPILITSSVGSGPCPNQCDMEGLGR